MPNNNSIRGKNVLFGAYTVRTDWFPKRRMIPNELGSLEEGTSDGSLYHRVKYYGDGRFIVVTEFANSRIQVFTMDGEPVFKFGDNGPERLDHPTSCVCYKETFFVTDKNNNCVKVFDERGQFLYKFGEKGHGDGQMDTPYGLCVDKHSNVLVYHARNIRIQQFALEGAFTGKTSSNIQFGFSPPPSPGILLNVQQCDGNENLQDNILVNFALQLNQ
ncbi:hypothetical protein pdam_00025682, partial [Pocillopora damicornis]